MIGGMVIECCEVPGRPDVLFVNVADRPYSKLETCGVLVEKNENSLKIQIGDSLWWQSGSCYWTPWQSMNQRDIAIPKRSYSGVTFESIQEKIDT